MDISILENMEELEYPMAGGLLAPQFGAVDMDNDGKKDLFVMDRVGNVRMTFINTGTAGEIAYRYDPSYLESFPEVTGWFVLKDYNQDGVEDLFMQPSQAGIPGIEVRKGTRDDDGKLQYTVLPQSEGSFDILYIPVGSGFTQIYVSPIDYPAIEDVDGDGDLDVLSFDPGGSTVTLYKNLDVEKGNDLDSLEFEFAESCYGRILESGVSQEISLSEDSMTCARFLQSDPDLEVRHAGSTLLSFDENGDGLQDLLIGDLSNDGLTLLTNEGTAENAWMTSQDLSFPSYDTPIDIQIFNSAFRIDVNNDNVKDLIVASNEKNTVQSNDHIWLYLNQGTDEMPEYRLHSKNFLVDQMMHFGVQSNPAFTDYNRDGLMDLVVGTNGHRNQEGNLEPSLFLFENIGSLSDPAYELVDEDYLGFSQFQSFSTNLAPAFGDVDGDGDIDAVIGDNNGDLYYVENENGTFAAPTYQYQDVNIGQQVKPFIFDVNQDGLGDLIIGERNFNSANGQVGSFYFIPNTGAVGSPEFIAGGMASNSTFGGISTKVPGYINNYSSPVLVEIEDDLLLLTGSERGDIHAYTGIMDNVEGAFDTLQLDIGMIREGERSTIAAADINDDGLLEFAIGNRRGGIAFYQTNISSRKVSSSDVDLPHSEIKIAPNPVKDKIEILNFENVAEANFEIYDLQGRLIQVPTKRSRTIDVSQLQTGVYILQMKTEQEVYQAKFVKVD